MQNIVETRILFLSIDLFDQMYLGNSPRRPSLILSPGISEPKLDSPRQDHRLTDCKWVGEPDLTLLTLRLL